MYFNVNILGQVFFFVKKAKENLKRKGDL